MFRITSTRPGSRIARVAALGALALLPLLPAAAIADEGTGYQIPLSAPGPAQILDQASAALRSGTDGRAAALIDQAEHRLLQDSLADNLPQQASVASMRDAVGVLDHARQALAGGDRATATSDVETARGML